ncbi:MAG: hypothetical protein U1E40_06115 [Amaricoccus sp.]
MCTCTRRAAGEALRASLVAVAAPRPRNPQAAGPEEQAAFKKLGEVVAEERRGRPPGRAWATDEHRLGLKPVRRRVWAPVGERPTAPGHHRFEWLYVTAFVAPSSGETVWYLERHRQAALRDDARELRPRDRRRPRPDHRPPARRRGLAYRAEPRGPRRHPPRLPAALHPELQPAEHLWPLVDAPIANTYFATLEDLDAVLAERCRTLERDRALIAANTTFHWWPKPERIH